MSVESNFLECHTSGNSNEILEAQLGIGHVYLLFQNTIFICFSTSIPFFILSINWNDEELLGKWQHFHWKFTHKSYDICKWNRHTHQQPAHNRMKFRIENASFLLILFIVPVQQCFQRFQRMHCYVFRTYHLTLVDMVTGNRHGACSHFSIKVIRRVMKCEMSFILCWIWILIFWLSISVSTNITEPPSPN